MSAAPNYELTLNPAATPLLATLSVRPAISLEDIVELEKYGNVHTDYDKGYFNKPRSWKINTMFKNLGGNNSFITATVSSRTLENETIFGFLHDELPVSSSGEVAVDDALQRIGKHTMDCFYSKYGASSRMQIFSAS